MIVMMDSSNPSTVPAPPPPPTPTTGSSPVVSTGQSNGASVDSDMLIVSSGSVVVAGGGGGGVSSPSTPSHPRPHSQPQPLSSILPMSHYSSSSDNEDENESEEETVEPSANVDRGRLSSSPSMFAKHRDSSDAVSVLTSTPHQSYIPASICNDSSGNTNNLNTIASIMSHDNSANTNTTSYSAIPSVDHQQSYFDEREVHADSLGPRHDAQTLEKIAKLFCGTVGTPEESEQFLSQQGQLIAAAVAAATMAAASPESLTPQEQLLASIAPTLMSILGLGASQAQATSQSSDSHSVASSNDEDSGPRSKKPRKQSKPVRYESSQVASPSEHKPNSPVEAKLGLHSSHIRHTSERRPKRKTKDSHNITDDDNGNDQDDDEDVGEAVGDDQQVEDAEEEEMDNSRHRFGEQRVEDGDDDGDSGLSENESEEMVREKQLSTMVNMFADLQQKLRQSCFCPQCNCPFASEDQLRAHIQIEHMQKLQFFPPTATNTTAFGAPSPTEFQKMAEQFAAVAAVQHKIQQNSAQQQHHKRKRKRSQSPSSQSVSSTNSSDGDCSLDRKSADDLLVSGLASGVMDVALQKPTNRAKSNHRRKESKDNLASHNLLALNLPPNFINPLISSLSTKSSSRLDSPCSQQQSSLDLKISTTTTSNPEQSQSQSPGAITSQSIGHSSFPSSMAPFLFPMMSAGGNQFQSTSAMLNGVPVPQNAVSGLRIFNPEAYCELCNKEFCNKYFLKTHKANKHGIYTPDGTSSSNGQFVSSSGSSVSSSSSSYMATSGGALMLTTSPAAGTTVHQGAKTHPSTGLSSSPGEQSPHQQSPFSLPMRLNLNMNVINLDSYCEICQKEFCNKYFLKKHKQKIHGFVYQGDTAVAPSQNSPQMQHFQQLQMLQQQLHAAAVAAAQQKSNSGECGPNTDPSQANASQPSNKVPSPSPSGHLSSTLLNASSTSLASSNNTTTTSSSSLANSTLSTAVSGSETLPNFFVTTASGQIGLTADKLRQMGVINADAFCEICCKEFCNKYFLRTHKINKHGIIDGQSIPAKYNANQLLVNSGAANLSQLLVSQASGMNAIPSIQTTMAAMAGGQQRNSQSPSNTNDDGTLEPGQRDPTTYGKNGGNFLNGFASTGVTGASALKCDFCPQQFPNNYLLKMHKFYTHNIPYIKQEEQETLAKEMYANNAKQTSPADREKSSPQPPMSVKMEPEQETNQSGGDLKATFDSDSEMESEMANMPHMLVSAELNHAPSPTSCQDLQKLHSMIKDLIPDMNNASSAGSAVDSESDRKEMDQQHRQSPVSDQQSGKSVCHLCRLEFDNRYFLRVHLMNDHDIVVGDDWLKMNSIQDSLTIKHLMEQGVKFPFGPIGNSESSEAFCDICNKEFCSKYFLKTHKQNIHGIYEHTPTNGSNTPTHPNETTPVIPPALLSSLYQRAKTPAEIESLNLALSQAAAIQAKINVNSNVTSSVSAGANKHGSNSSPNAAPNTNNNANNASIAATIKAAMAAGLMPGGGEQKSGRASSMVTGRNYCNICNKELCNKYFMKTHMLKMHGINIDEHPIEAASTSTIGGVTCDICQKELCSKYFLKVHKQNTHGIYDDGSSQSVMLGSNLERMQQQQQQQNTKLMMSQPFNPADINPLLLMSIANSNSTVLADGNSVASDSNSVCSANSEKDNHRASLPDTVDGTGRPAPNYQEVCQICDRRFKSVKWLKAHMMNDHGEMLAMMRSNQDLTQAIAQATGADVEQVSKLCFICGQMFADRVAMHVHLVKEHKTTTEELAINMAGNIKMAAIMAAAAAAAAAEPSNVSDLSMRLVDAAANAEESVARHSPHSLTSSASPSYPPSSPQCKPNGGEQPPSNPLISSSPSSILTSTAIQNLILKNSGLNLSFAAAAAAVADNSMTSGQQLLPHSWMSSLFGSGEKLSPSRSQSPLDMKCGQTAKTSIPKAEQAKKPVLNKFCCQICTRSYRHSHSLQRHMASHKNDKPASKTDSNASVNGKNSNSTSNQSDLCAISKITTPTSNNKPRNKRYRCSKCNKKFRTRELCLVHIRALHSTGKGTPNSHLSVESVTKQASSPSNLSRKSGNQARCSICGQTFSSMGQLKVHIGKCHNTLQSSFPVVSPSGGRKSPLTVNARVQFEAESVTNDSARSPNTLFTTTTTTTTTTSSTKSEDDDDNIPLNLRTGGHPLPPSPSASSEDDLQSTNQSGAHPYSNHRQSPSSVQSEPLRLSMSPNSHNMASFGLDADLRDESKKFAGYESSRTTTSSTINKAEHNIHLPIKSDASVESDEEPESHTNATVGTISTSRPSLICVNGEQY